MLMATEKKIQPCAVCGQDAIPDDIFGGLRHVLNAFDWEHKAKANLANPDPKPILDVTTDEDDELGCSECGVEPGKQHWSWCQGPENSAND